jgi:hypothetical protein
MKKPLNNPMPPQMSGIAKMAEAKSQIKQMNKTMMMAEAMTMAKRMSDTPMPMKLKGCCGK